jgi:hypothetical protein
VAVSPDDALTFLGAILAGCRVDQRPQLVELKERSLWFGHAQAHPSHDLAAVDAISFGTRRMPELTFDVLGELQFKPRGGLRAGEQTDVP